MTNKRRGFFKRETLIQNLKTVVERIPQLDLPARIVAIYSFGGILRDKKRLHDFDLVLFYTLAPEQKARWERFRRNFSTHLIDEHRNPIFELREYFNPYRKQDIPLREAVKDESLSKVLRDKGIEPSWAGCFSWTEIFNNPHGIFIPEIEVVIRKMLLGRRVKGLQVLVFNHEDFSAEKAPIAAKNYVLAWSPEAPDIQKNLDSRTPMQKIEFLTKELDHFLNNEIPKLRKAYLEAKERIAKANVKAGLKLDIEALDGQHIKIERTGNELYQELLEKCERARTEMRRYREETAVLEELARNIEHWNEVKNETYFTDHCVEDYVTLWTLDGVRKQEVKEERIREILRVIGLPENNVMALRSYRNKVSFHLAKNAEEKVFLLRRAEFLKVETKCLKAIMKTIRPIDKGAYAHLVLTDAGKPKQLEIIVDGPVEEDNEAQKQAIIKELRAKGFETKDWKWYISGKKEVRLKGTETIQELQAIAKKMMS
ncbi:MAG: hypothetical protein COT21_03340 [Hadesarchaea archaeon CG08_land_8_20_14_0_20_51_8]|nr:MAG: hypothetical protein COT21_03340 [Hadesarchaea archaeon CG08_land_8_20_14_0_20_51_8]